MILNLGMSESFGEVELTRLRFPVVMEVDYIRVYQKKGRINVGCDPEDFPTASYIEQCVLMRDLLCLCKMFNGSMLQAHGSLYKPKFDDVGRRLR